MQITTNLVGLLALVLCSRSDWATQKRPVAEGTHIFGLWPSDGIYAKGKIFPFKLRTCQKPRSKRDYEQQQNSPCRSGWAHRTGSLRLGGWLLAGPCRCRARRHAALALHVPVSSALFFYWQPSASRPTACPYRQTTPSEKSSHATPLRVASARGRWWHRWTTGPVRHPWHDELGSA